MRRVVYFLLSLIFFTIWSPVFAGNPPDQGKSTISGTTAPADGLTSSTVTIVLRDASGNTLPGNDSITISSSNSSATFNPSTTTLDGSGVFYTQVKSTFVGSVPITVTDNSTSNTQITGSIAFYQPGTAPPSPGACTDPAPGSDVQLVSAKDGGAHSIILTWKDAANPVTYYGLSYGVSAGNYIYGAPNIGGQGATSYTVGGLTTGKTYYFIVRAVNGCTPGNASNELSAIAGAASPTPTPIPVTIEPTIVVADTPIDTPTEIPTEAPTPTLMSEPVATTGSSFLNSIMIGATAVGVVCAIAGGIVYLRMKKRRS